VDSSLRVREDQINCIQKLFFAIRKHRTEIQDESVLSGIAELDRELRATGLANVCVIERENEL
jgi:hypothetical protein